jgi:hypothetical protein
MNSRRFNRLIRMYPDRFEDPTAPYPKWRIAVRGSVTYFAVHRKTHGMVAYGTNAKYRGWMRAS